MQKNLVPIHLRLTEEEKQRIGQLAQETGHSRCAYIRQIVRGYLRYLDEYDDPEKNPMDWKVKGRPRRT